MSNLAVITPKLSKLIPMLATEYDGEVVATVRAISRTLEGAGMDFHSLVEALCEPKLISAPPSPPKPEPASQPKSLWDIAIWLRAHATHRMTYKEQKFVMDMATRLGMGRRASTKQENWLRSIYYWYGGDVP